MSSAARILIIEDDRTLNHQISSLLSENGYETDQRFDGRQGLVSALSNAYDLVLLDVLLPGLDGFNLLSKLRKKRQTPVMMLTACGAEQERITGYSNGADDYLSKPFNVTEFLLRIEALLRRTRNNVATHIEQTLLQTTCFELDRKKNSVTKGAAELTLTPMEFKLLWALVIRKGEVLSKPYLYQSVMNRDFSRYDRSLDMHLSRVRRKLTKAGIDASHIETVHGEGYCYK
ncbi:response regulator transcription factor [Neptuniibacter sp.]|uniref:response regulator transcription factor n=1 Tax=Neptuniibacter sp. TaxID=1962643 RepID=UPI00262106DF|nr:response regulator transcription factor [Neptuniibacter sp.]MCP4595276.1 response regulator transcription factor [Neptuniibacter sp.]